MPSAFEVVSLEQLHDVTGGGIGSTIGSLFGQKGAKWGGLFDNIIGMFKGGGGGGGGGSQPSGDASGGDSSGG